MPPIRSAKKKTGATLASFGFSPITREEAIAKANAVRVKVSLPEPIHIDSEDENLEGMIQDQDLDTRQNVNARHPTSTPSTSATLSQPATSQPENAVSSSGSRTEPPKPAPAPRETLKPRTLPKLAGKGENKASFETTQAWANRYQSLGTKTRKVLLGNQFKLEDVHIDELIAMGQGVCHHLWDFNFTFTDVDNWPRNDATALTDEAVIRLAQKCPNLRNVQIQGNNKLTDRALVSLFENCSDLSSLEISCTNGGSTSITGTAFDMLQQRPGWASGLKKLHLPKDDGKNYMKAMRELSRAREDLKIQLIAVTTDTVKYYGSDSDDYLQKTFYHYRKGRLQDTTYWSQNNPYENNSYGGGYGGKSGGFRYGGKYSGGGGGYGWGSRW